MEPTSVLGLNREPQFIGSRFCPCFFNSRYIPETSLEPVKARDNSLKFMQFCFILNVSLCAQNYWSGSAAHRCNEEMAIPRDHGSETTKLLFQKAIILKLSQKKVDLKLSAPTFTLPTLFPVHWKFETFISFYKVTKLVTHNPPPSFCELLKGKVWVFQVVGANYGPNISR